MNMKTGKSTLLPKPTISAPLDPGFQILWCEVLAENSLFRELLRRIASLRSGVIDEIHVFGERYLITATRGHGERETQRDGGVLDRPARAEPRRGMYYANHRNHPKDDYCHDKVRT